MAYISFLPFTVSLGQFYTLCGGPWALIFSVYDAALLISQTETTGTALSDHVVTWTITERKNTTRASALSDKEHQSWLICGTLSMFMKIFNSMQQDKDAACNARTHPAVSHAL